MYQALLKNHSLQGQDAAPPHTLDHAATTRFNMNRERAVWSPCFHGLSLCFKRQGTG